MTEHLTEHSLAASDPTDPETSSSIVDTILDLDAMLSADVRRAEGSVRFCSRPGLYDQLDRLLAELESLTDATGRPLDEGEAAVGEAGAGRAEQVARAVESTRAEMQRSMTTVRMEQVSDDDWDAFNVRWRDQLAEPEHPERRAMFNALIALTATAPKMSAEQVAGLRSKLPRAVMVDLANKAFDLNAQVGVSVPKSPLSSAVLRHAARAKS